MVRDQVTVIGRVRRIAALVDELSAGMDELDKVLRTPVRADCTPQLAARRHMIRGAISDALDDARFQLDDITWEEDLDGRTLTLRLRIGDDFESDES